MNPIMPRELKIAQTGGATTLTSRRYPKILAGVCEECGVLRPDLPGEIQYKFCKHYAGMDMKCSYCKATADHPEVVRMSEMLVKDHPHLPNQLVCMCNSYECNRRFEQEFHLR